MKKLILFLCISISLNTVKAQSFEYYHAITTADSLRKVKDYINSANSFSKAISLKHEQVSANLVYNTACMWALAGKSDSAFYYLHLAIDIKNYNNFQKITTDADLTQLRNDSRWQQLVNQVEKNNEEADKRLNKPLVQQLDSIVNTDQKYRKKYDEVENKYGQNSTEFKKLLLEMERADSINLINVKVILDKFGWLGPDVVSEKGNLAFFLVIQHADLQTQIHYLTTMKDAVNKGNASHSNLALLIDRIKVRQGEKQIYGTQVMSDPKTGKPIIAPIEDEKDVDKRREAAGLSPLADYAKLFGIIYKPADTD